MVLFVSFWWLVGFTLEEILTALVPAIADRFPLRAGLTLLLGIALPQSAAVLKNRLLTPRTAPYLRWLQTIDEQTGLYLERIIYREERKLNIDFFRVDSEKRRRALDRLFEYHNIAISCEEVQRHQSPENALGIFKIRQHDVKFKYILRFLGYSSCIRDLTIIAERPDILFPTWPADTGDRRKGKALNDTTAGTPILGRRKYEDPDIQAYVLGFSRIPIKRKYQVFVSSTFLDLREERQQVLRSLLRCGCIPAGMEFFPSSDEELWTLIRGVVDDCDYYILLVGSRYGSLTSTGISYTEAEYDYARILGLPVLAFFHAKPGLSGGEEPDQVARLQLFKEKVSRAHAPAFWNSPDELPGLIQQAIENARQKYPGRGWVRSEVYPPSS